MAAAAADLEVAVATAEDLAEDSAAAVADSAAVPIITDIITIITTDHVFTADSGDPDVIITAAEAVLEA